MKTAACGTCSQGVPPLTLAEFEELACWFEANRERLRALSLPSYLREVGDGKRDSVSNLCSKLDEGPRGWEAGEVAGTLGRGVNPDPANHTRLDPAGLVGQAVYARWLDDFPQGAGAGKRKKSTLDCLEYRPVTR
jgi:hypothetical protein